MSAPEEFERAAPCVGLTHGIRGHVLRTLLNGAGGVAPETVIVSPPVVGKARTDLKAFEKRNDNLFGMRTFTEATSRAEGANIEVGAILVESAFAANVVPQKRLALNS